MFVVAPGKTGWEFVETNVGTPETFQKSQKSCDTIVPKKEPGRTEVPQAPPVTAPKAADAGEATGNLPKTSPEDKARLEKEVADRKAQDDKWCENVAREGFNCDPSPSEITRLREELMRENARLQAERVKEGPDVTPKEQVTAPASPQIDIEANRGEGK